jgi:sugar phosphate permease
VLAAGTLSQASFSAITVGLAVLAPVLRDEYALSLTQIGALLSAAWLGAFATLFPWGLLADRVGERRVLVVGLAGAALFLTAAAFAPSCEALFVLLALAGASGASVNSASGRAVMFWFARSERGLALGIRQTAIPLGGLVVAVVLPRLAAETGSSGAFLFLAGFCAIGAVVGGLVLRGVDDGVPVETTAVRRTLQDGRLRRLSLASGLYLYAQVALIGFGVLFLHDEHGVSNAHAALVIAAAQALAVGLRIGAGRWSDLAGSRVRPLIAIGVAVALSVALTGALADGPGWLLVPVVAVAGGLSMGWNGLSFTAAAELAGTARSGAAIGFQQGVLSGLGVLAPVAFAATVAAGTWRGAFVIAALLPLAGALALRPLRSF